MRLFTKREVMQARKAREMLSRMGFPSVAQAIRTTNTGSNFDITARDFEVADTIWGKDVASMKGKTKKQASPIPDITVSAITVQKEQVLSIDIMFVKKLAILIGVCTPLDLTLATSLTTMDMLKPSRAAEAVRKGISCFLGVMRSQGFIAKLIMTDGEGATAKLKGELNMLGVKVDISGAGGHVARVERRIQVIKERMRTHLHHLPFALSLLCLSMLALYCVSRLNYEPSSIRECASAKSRREARLPLRIRRLRTKYSTGDQQRYEGSDGVLRSDAPHGEPYRVGKDALPRNRTDRYTRPVQDTSDVIVSHHGTKPHGSHRWYQPNSSTRDADHHHSRARYHPLSPSHILHSTHTRCRRPL